MGAAEHTDEVVVIGAGQAGLSVASELASAGVPHVILERERVASAWTQLWDSFRLNTPSWSVQLPGHPYDGPDPDGFLSREGIGAHLTAYATSIAVPVREGVAVTSLRRDTQGLRLETSDGPLVAPAVVVCTGAYQTPFRPPAAQGFPADLATLDVRGYRNPGALPDGVIVVVGNGQSGCQIAEDLVDAGRDVILSCGRAPWAPRRAGGHDLLWWAIETGFLDQTVEDLPSPAARFAANVTASGVDGGHDLDVRVLQRKGVTPVGRHEGVREGRFRFAGDLLDSVAWADARYLDFREDAERLCRERGMPIPELPDPEPFVADAPTSIAADGIGAVIFAGGFRPGYDWIRIPKVVDALGFPAQTDGASAMVPGLFFAGVHFLRTRRSSLLCGIADDAAVVARGVARHLGVAVT